MQNIIVAILLIIHLVALSYIRDRIKKEKEII